MYSSHSLPKRKTSKNEAWKKVFLKKQLLHQNIKELKVLSLGFKVFIAARKDREVIIASQTLAEALLPKIFL
jgi:hypothetical protein